MLGRLLRGAAVWWWPVCGLVLFLAGCNPFPHDPPQRSAAGVLIGEDGTPYIAFADCSPTVVRRVGLSAYSGEGGQFDIPDDEWGPVLEYVFDPPVLSSEVLVPIDPTNEIEGAARTIYDAERFAWGMALEKPSGGGNPHEQPRVVAEVDTTYQNGVEESWGEIWWGDQLEPGTFYSDEVYRDALDWECVGEPVWDFSVVDG